jgi:ketosteroid isomerase-like protein
MPNDHAQAFIDALHTLERDGDADALVALYADDATSDNLTAADPHRGPDGARTFWQADRGLFDEIASEFRSVTEADDRVALEWVRTGRARDGSAVRYAGVSIVQFSGEQVSRFSAYYDPAQLGQQIA